MSSGSSGMWTTGQFSTRSASSGCGTEKRSSKTEECRESTDMCTLNPVDLLAIRTTLPSLNQKVECLSICVGGSMKCEIKNCPSAAKPGSGEVTRPNQHRYLQ